MFRILSLVLLIGTLSAEQAAAPPTTTTTPAEVSAPENPAPKTASAPIVSAPNGSSETPKPPAPPGSQHSDREGNKDQRPATGMDMTTILLFVGGFMVLMFWTSARANRREKKRREEVLASLRVGSQIQTIGGVKGEIVRVGEQDVDVKTGGGTVITFVKGAISAPVGGDTPAKKE